MAWQRARCIVITAALVVATYAGTAIAAQESGGHPVRLHQGTCDDVGAVAFELTGVGAEITLEGSPVPTIEMMGPEGSRPILLSVTTLEADLLEIVDGGHTMVVSESDEAMERIIACGDVGGPRISQMVGMVMPGDELAIVLAEHDGSGYAGIALLTAEGLTTTVRIYLAQDLAGNELPSADQGDEEAEA
ncbi:MAG: hypothetical protein M3457_13705, partial [Chloroflexota bacterium]|nr:hypothetical protein [Chloroflexota bacterium]